MRWCGGIIPPQGVRGCYTLARCHSLIKQAEPQNDRRVPVVLSCKVTCSFCSFWRRRRSWRLSPACPLSPWSFRLPRKPVCRLLWIRCFPCSLLWGITPCSDFCLSRVVCRSIRGFIHRLRGNCFTFRRQAFISARACDEAATTFLVLRMLACSPHFVIEVALSPYTPLKARE